MITYLGMQDELIAFADTNKEKLENLPCVVLTEIRETEEPVELVGGTYYVGQDKIDEAKKEIVRNVRNHLLEQEIDPVVSNPLRWNDMSEEDKELYTSYRKYLLNYTENDGWWNKNPFTLDEWKELPQEA